VPDLRVVDGATKRTHTTRPKRVQLATVLAAEASGQMAAARATGIPRETIRDWMAKPEYAEIRRKTREDLAEEYKVAAHLAVKRVTELLPTMEARDAIFAFEKSAELSQLLSGQATTRSETRDLTAELDDHERDILAAVIRKAIDEEVLV
jgi:hypothetical protein